MKNNKPMQRAPKKTVSIEVRVSEEEKQAFSEACQSANRPVSAVLRQLMVFFVTFRKLRTRILSMFKRIFQRPLSATLAAIGMAAAMSVSLMVSPMAAADARLSYQIIIDDGLGQIVSQGQTGTSRAAEDPTVFSDTLGEAVRYAFEVLPCDQTTELSCPSGGSVVVLSIWESQSGAVELATDRGIVLSTSGETRFEATLSDGRILSALFVNQATD